MRAQTLLLAIAVGIGPAGAWAQVYKCGSTFSDRPCGSNPVKVGGASAGNSADPATAAGEGLPEYVTTCLNAIRAQGNFVDKEGLRVDGHSKKWENFEYADKPMAGPKVTLSINAMGPNGAYTGARNYSCYMSEDARRVLRVSGL